MFGLRDDVERELDAMIDAGVLLNIRIEQARFNAKEDFIWAWCHVSPQVNARLQVKSTHWGGGGIRLNVAITNAVRKWMELVRP